jgi:plasmid replication initiation protein
MRLHEVIRDVAHGLYVTRRSLLARYLTVSRIARKCNSAHVQRKSAAFLMEIFTELTNSEWYFWLIRRTEFRTDLLSSIRTLRASVRYDFQLADFHENNACLTTSIYQEILSLITRKSNKRFSRWRQTADRLKATRLLHTVRTFYLRKQHVITSDKSRQCTEWRKKNRPAVS